MKSLRCHLVQRVRLRRPEDRLPERGAIDGVFVFDYMGAAEFEWGALPSCLKELRAAPVPLPVPLRVAEHTAWFVGRPELQPYAQTFFEAELRHPWEDTTPKPYYLKESSGLYWSYHPKPSNQGRDVFDGWWALDEGRSWALFRTEEAAQLWWDGLAAAWPKSLRERIAEKLGAIFKGRGPRGWF